MTHDIRLEARRTLDVGCGSNMVKAWNHQRSSPRRNCQSVCCCRQGGYLGSTCQAMLKYFSTEAVANQALKVGTSGAALKSMPNTSRKGFYLSPWQLSLAETAKFGKWPSNYQVRTRMPSFLNKGFESEREPLDVRFKMDNPGKDIVPFSVGYVDGHCRGLMCQLIMALLIYCEAWLMTD